MSEWKDLEDKIRKMTENEPVPESLAPENMERKLRIKEAEMKEKKPFLRKRQIIRWGSAVAAFGLLIVIVAAVSLTDGFMTKGMVMNDKAETAGIEEQISEDEVITGATSYGEIYEKIFGIQNSARNGFYENMAGEGLGEESDKEMSGSFAVTDEMADGAATNGVMYSTTNLQEEGVGEADTVITDGNYLYIMEQNTSKITIVKADGATLETMSEIDVGIENEEQERYLHEFYVNHDRLYMLTTEYSFADNKCTEETRIITYDISDRKNPKEAGVLSQSGSYHSSRLNGGYLYVFSDYCIYDEVIAEEPGTFVPLVQGEAIPCQDIYIPDNADSCNYKVISSINLGNPQEFVQKKAVLCGSGLAYVSMENIYFTSYVNQSEDSEYDMTEIWRFGYKDGKITGSASGKVRGEIRDQFALSENGGYLRVVTTYCRREEEKETLIDESAGVKNLAESSADFIVDIARINTGETKNGLYILDASLNLTGSIEDLAPGERIYSARFFENTGYFVTYRETDPLFSVDLSDPANPKLLGELKIPGFSEYLHPYGEGLLLGIGYITDEENGIRQGIKLSMFDISDPSNVKEVAVKELVSYDNNVSWAECGALYDHKKVLVDDELNIIGFQLESGDSIYKGAGKWDETRNNRYLIYGFDREAGFYEKMADGYTVLTVSGNTEEDNEMKEKKEGELRGIYVDKYLYMVNRNYEIRVYDMENGFALAATYEY